MSLMAGFDFVTEFSNAALVKLIKTQFTIMGTPVNPTFEFDLWVDSIGGNAHFIVNDLLLDLSDDDRMTLTLKFTNTSFIGQAPVVTVAALDGEIVINARIFLSSSVSQPTQRMLAIDLSSYIFDPDASAKVGVKFTTPNNKIAEQLAGTGISVQAFKDQIEGAVASLIISGVTTFNDVAFTVVSGANGSLGPLVFERLEAHCIGNSDPAKQALGLFGILLLSNHSDGNHTQKTSLAIATSHEVAISFSPEVFHVMLFCPSMANRFGTDVGSLPITCGTSLAFNNGDVTFNFLADSFASGHIDIDGFAQKSGPCYEASVDFHGTLTFNLSGNTLTPIVQMDEPEVDPDIDWYCLPAGGILVGLESLTAGAVADAIAQGIADGEAQDAIDDALGQNFASTGVPAFANAIYDQVSITAEGLTLNGMVPMFIPVNSGIPEIDLNGSVTTSGTEQLSSGTYHYPGIPPFCEAKDFPYTEIAQNQTGTYQAMPSFLGQPLQLEWSLLSGTSGSTKVTPLSDDTGTVAVLEHTSYPFPPDTGGTSLDQLVHLQYSINNDVIQLKNTPSEGNYSLVLKVKATDPVGNVAEGSKYITFEGNVVEFGGGYDEYVAECYAEGKAFWHKISTKYAPSAQFVPRWVPVNFPPSEKLLEMLYVLASSPAPEAQAVLPQTVTAHRSSFLRVLSDLKAGKIGFMKGKIVAK